MKKKRILNLVTTITATCIALIIAEVGMHFYYPVDYRRPPEKRPKDAWRELLHQPSPIPGLAYELAPNREKYARSTMVKTNSFGMRDDEPLPKIFTNLRRVAVLGDSYTFGFGVHGEHTYPSVLERLLHKGPGGHKFDVMNFGTGGYSTRDEALVFKHKVIDWDLDLLIIGYYLNDPEIDPIQPLHYYYQDVSWWQHFNLFRRIAEAKNLWEIKKYGEGDYFRYLHAEKGRKWKSVVSALEDIRSVANERKIPVLLIIFPVTSAKPWDHYPYKDIHQQVTRTAKEKGIYVLDLYEKFSQYPGRRIMVNTSDRHPSKLGHEVAAQAIYQWMVENKELAVVPRPENNER